MLAIDYIEKTREYLDYLERHIRNVEKAWKIFKEKCADFRVIQDDVFYNHLERDIFNHDVSKLLEDEFIQYRRAFYPTEFEKRDDYLKTAWPHHIENNSHHWQNWTKRTSLWFHPDDWEVDCAHMVIDWMAMGFEFGDTPKSYYEKNMDKIELPAYAIDFIYEIFKRIE